MDTEPLSNVLYVKPELLDLVSSLQNQDTIITANTLVQEELVIRKVTSSKQSKNIQDYEIDLFKTLAQIMYAALCHHGKRESGKLSEDVALIHSKLVESGKDLLPLPTRRLLKNMKEGFVVVNGLERTSVQYDSSNCAFYLEPTTEILDTDIPCEQEYITVASKHLFTPQSPVVALIAAITYSKEELSASTSALGSEIRQLKENLENKGFKLEKLPSKPFVYFVEGRNQNISINGSVFCLNYQKTTNGDGRFTLVELEDGAIDEDTIVLDPEYLANVHYKKTKQVNFQLDPNYQKKDLKSKIVREYYASCIKPHLLKDNRQGFVKRLQQILNKGGRQKVQVQLFGSSVNNLGFKDSDIDITLVTETDKHPFQNMFKLASVLRNGGMMDVNPIRRARVPICKFRDPRLKIDCDVNVGHRLGVYNSQLIHTYTIIEPKCRKLILLVKDFAKKRNINDPTSNSISSYAYSLMVIAYLQEVEGLITLQEDGGERTTIRVPEINGERSKFRTVDVTFISDCNHPKIQSYKPISKSIDELFYEFLIYFGYKFTYDKIISVKGGMVDTADCLYVLDPFEVDRNCTSMVGGNLGTIVKEFQHGVQLFEKGDLKGLFNK
ncbi:Terminal uridylyltransferase 4 [Boothiomyces sp. JEL0838]|nr:Terminal uridylyltransferase 4 [Boothiomyces sp. JEL0838]